MVVGDILHREHLPVLLRLLILRPEGGVGLKKCSKFEQIFFVFSIVCYAERNEMHICPSLSSVTN